ncbi:MAG: hypothetical protein HY299_00015 [Verrucomicrobia bacterium]|nr:hypothetical protein [Verrucomicrobiota bacterium]
MKDPEDPDVKREIEERFQWNVRTIVGDYGRVGSQSARWDEPVRKALELMAHFRVHGAVDASRASYSDSIRELIRAARAAGCDDPLALYLYARLGVPETMTEKDRAQLYAEAADGIESRGYSPIRKFYAHLRAAERLSAANERQQGQAAVHKHSTRAWDLCIEFIGDKAAPSEDVREAVEELVKYWSGRLQPKRYEALEAALLRHWGNEAWVYRFKGTHFKEFAWEARGNGYADTVSEEGWRLFSERLEIAERALLKSWEMNPSDPETARALMGVELGQGRGRDRLEQWFSRAMKLNTNFYEACSIKLTYLEPKWHGSARQMLEFGRECARSKEWGWSVPLIIAEAHQSLARYDQREGQDYWADPSVWPEIESCFEAFFARYGEQGLGWRHNYARFAYKCRKWSVLRRELPLLGKVNYDFFGGREAFEQMKREVEEHLSETK